MLTVIRLFEAFVNWQGGTDPIIAYADLSRLTEVIKTAFLVAIVLTSDAMIVRESSSYSTHTMTSAR